MVVLLKKLSRCAMFSPTEASEEFRLGVVRCFKALLLRLEHCSDESCLCKRMDNMIVQETSSVCLQFSNLNRLLLLLVTGCNFFSRLLIWRLVETTEEALTENLSPALSVVHKGSTDGVDSAMGALKSNLCRMQFINRTRVKTLFQLSW